MSLLLLFGTNVIHDQGAGLTNHARAATAMVQNDAVGTATITDTDLP